MAVGCPTIPETTYGDFCERILKQARTQNLPVDGVFELTYRCNIACQHCLVKGSEDRKRELSTGEIKRMADEAADAGCLWVLITGGEPLIRDDFFELYTYIKEKGLLITLFTNGTLIDENVADFFARWRPFSIEITLLGATRETYDKVTQMPGSYDSAMRAIDLLIERDIPLSLKTVVMEPNKHEVAAMRRFAHEKDIKFRMTWLVEPRRDGSMAPCELRIPPEEAALLDTDFVERREEHRRLLAQPGEPVDNGPFMCFAGMWSFGIDPYGTMKPCAAIDDPSYNLRQGSIAEGLRLIKERIRATERSRDLPCFECRLSPSCNLCQGVAALENGERDSVVDYCCEIAHIRAEELGYTAMRNTN